MIKFTDFSYFLLLSLAVFVYYRTPGRGRWIWLLLTSVLFNLSWSGTYIVVWFALTGLCYFAGRYIGNPDHPKKRRKIVKSVSVVVSLLPLLFFKYFLPSGVFDWSRAGHWLVPVGISYYTFLIVGYLVDVGRKFIRPETHPGYLAVYLGFFPTLLSGPLERARRFLPQLKTTVAYDPDHIRAGICFIIWGLFKKVVLASRFADHTNPVFNAPGQYTAFSVFMAVLLFSVQLYCDFSGYCDIAMGSARLFGIRLSKNFANRYYFIPSRAESWNAWNITITSWFRDYVFFSVSKGVTNPRILEFNRLLTFLVTGLWHGASWSFVVWGGLQWAYVTFERNTQRFWDRMYTGMGVAVKSYAQTGGRIVIRLLTGTLIMGWFRAAELDKGIALYGSMFGISAGAHSFIVPGFLLTVALFLVMDFINYRMGEKEDIASYLLAKKPVIRSLYLFFLVELVLVFGRIEVPDFYYIQF